MMSQKEILKIWAIRTLVMKIDKGHRPPLKLFIKVNTSLGKRGIIRGQSKYYFCKGAKRKMKKRNGSR